MGVEMKLSDALQTATTDFTDRVKKIIEEMKNKTQNFIKEVQEQMDQFNVQLKQHALAEFDRLTSLTEDQNQEFQEQLSDGIVYLLEDREVLTSHVEASKENIDSKISDKESDITRTIGEDWKVTENRITDA